MRRSRLLAEQRQAGRVGKPHPGVGFLPYAPGPLDLGSIMGLSPVMAHCHGVYSWRMRMPAIRLDPFTGPGLGSALTWGN